MKNLFTIVAVLILSGFVFITSCKKEVIPTVAEIRVVDENGDPVPFADITMSCTSSVNLPCEVEIFGTTDKNGVYQKEFDLPSVLHVYTATRVNDTTIIGIPPNVTIIIESDSICGESFISIKPEQTSVQKIIMYDCN